MQPTSNRTASSIIFSLLLLVLSCGDERVLGPSTEIIERPAGSETYFLLDTANGNNPEENTIRIGGVIAVDLEAKGEILPDSVIDSFKDEPGVDIVKISIENTYTHQFRLEEGLDIDVELIDPFNATVFRLNQANPVFSGVLQAGNYGMKFYNNLPSGAEEDNRKLIFLRPDEKLAAEDPLAILAEKPIDNLDSDHYMMITDTDCIGCDLSYGFFEYFTFYAQDERRIQLTDLRAEAANFSHAKMNNVDISGEFITEANFEYAELNGSAFFDIAEMTLTKFDRSILRGAIFNNVSGRFTTFEYCDMRKMKATNFSFQNSSLVDCVALGSEMSDGDFTGSDFTFFKGGGSLMNGTNFTSCVFNSADLVGCDLSNTKFDNSNLTEANFANADVSNSSFCRIFQYRNVNIKLASGISSAKCLFDLIEKIDAEKAREADEEEQS